MVDSPLALDLKVLIHYEYGILFTYEGMGCKGL